MKSWNTSVSEIKPIGNAYLGNSVVLPLALLSLSVFALLAAFNRSILSFLLRAASVNDPAGGADIFGSSKRQTPKHLSLSNI